MIPSDCGGRAAGIICGTIPRLASSKGGSANSDSVDACDGVSASAGRFSMPRSAALAQPAACGRTREAPARSALAVTDVFANFLAARARAASLLCECTSSFRFRLNTVEAAALHQNRTTAGWSRSLCRLQLLLLLLLLLDNNFDLASACVAKSRDPWACAPRLGRDRCGYQWALADSICRAEYLNWRAHFFPGSSNALDASRGSASTAVARANVPVPGNPIFSICDRHACIFFTVRHAASQPCRCLNAHLPWG